MNYSDQIGELLNKINAPASPYQKRAQICRVRTYGTFDNGDENQLLYNVEPVDNVNYNSNTAYKENFESAGANKGKGIRPLEQVMTSPELQKSMNNWIFNVTINANPSNNVQNIQIGMFMLPKIDSYVVIEWFNDTDAYISLTSEISKIKITNEKNDTVEFTPESAFKVGITSEEVELIVSNVISLKNKDNVIEVKEDAIDIKAKNINSDLNIESNKRTTIHSNTFSSLSSGDTILKAASFDMEASGTGRYSIKNGLTSLFSIHAYTISSLNAAIQALLSIDTALNALGAADPNRTANIAYALGSNNSAATDLPKLLK